MSCILRASGTNFEVDEFLKTSSLDAVSVFHRGDKQSGSPAATQRRAGQSGVVFSVSTREFSDLRSQIHDAIEFLLENDEELKRLRHFPGLERMEMDFPVEDRDVVFQSDGFPPSLLSLLGNLAIGLVISRHPAYWGAEEQTPAEQ
jgi:hypothetical protein